MNIKQTLIYHHLCGNIDLSEYINNRICSKNYITYIEHVGYNIYTCKNIHGLAKCGIWYWIGDEKICDIEHKNKLLYILNKIKNNIEEQLEENFKYILTNIL